MDTTTGEEDENDDEEEEEGDVEIPLGTQTTDSDSERSLSSLGESWWHKETDRQSSHTTSTTTRPRPIRACMATTTPWGRTRRRTSWVSPRCLLAAALTIRRGGRGKGGDSTRQRKAGLKEEE